MAISKKPINLIVAAFTAFVSSIAFANPTTDSVAVNAQYLMDSESFIKVKQ